MVKDAKEDLVEEDVAQEQHQANETTDQNEKKSSVTDKVKEKFSKKPSDADKLTELQVNLDAMEDKYLRAEAEMANMNTRFKKEQEQLLKYSGQSLAKDVLPVIDNLERALSIEIDTENGEQLKKGIELVYKDAQKALTNNDVIEIATDGVMFDPTIHQAVQTVPASDDQKADTIVQVLQKGYKLKDRVLRPAMVVVAQ